MKFTKLVENAEIKADKYGDILEDLKSYIDKTVENIGGDYDTFVSNYINSEDDFKIEGLINDSDVFDFYVKWRNEVDELLNEIKHFDKSPNDNNIYGCYDFIVVSTNIAIKEILSLK